MQSRIHESRFFLSNFHASRSSFSPYHASRINPLPPSCERKLGCLFVFVAPEMKHGDIELVVSRFFAESWWVGQSGKKTAQESSRVTTDQPRTSLKAIYLPVLSESCLQHVYCSIGRHGQRQSFLSDDKVLCQPSVNKAILGEFQSKMIVSWQQYGNENSLAFISVDFGLST